MGISTTRRALLKMGILLVPALRAHAQERPTGVVELFTSQGCSRCPPADKLFAELAQKDDIIALAYHVDYWDYLGWRDDLATPENTVRQQAYGHVFNTTVYTPQAVVNGQKNVVGSSRESLYAALQRGPSAPGTLSVDVALSSTAENFLIDIGGDGTYAEDAHVTLVNYQPQQTVQIAGGDNKGRTIDYRNIVTSYQTVGVWRGKPMRIELPKNEVRRKGGGCAVLLQATDAAGHPGPILGAASLAKNIL